MVKNKSNFYDNIKYTHSIIEDLQKRVVGVNEFAAELIRIYSEHRKEAHEIISFYISANSTGSIPFAPDCAETIGSLGADIERDLKKFMGNVDMDYKEILHSIDDLKKNHNNLETASTEFEKALVEWIKDERSEIFDQDLKIRGELQELYQKFKQSQESHHKLVEKLVDETASCRIDEATEIQIKLQSFVELFFTEFWPSFSRVYESVEGYEDELLQYVMNEVDFDIELIYDFVANDIKETYENPSLAPSTLELLNELGYDSMSVFEKEVVKRPVIRVRALYDNEKTAETELSFKEGDLMILLDSSDKNWWWVKNSHGLEGHVPANYIEIINNEEEQKETPKVEEKLPKPVEKDAIISAHTIEKDVRMNENAVDINQKIANQRKERHNEVAVIEQTIATPEKQQKSKNKNVFQKLFGKKKDKEKKTTKTEETQQSCETFDTNSMTGSVTGEYLTHFDSKSVLEKYNLDRFIDGVPELITDCVAYLLERGRQEEGLFRIPGQHSRIRELAAAYAANDAPNLMEEYDPMTIAGLLKYHFMVTRECIISRKLQDIVVEAHGKSELEQVLLMRVSMNDEDVISKANRNILKLVFFLFNEIVQNESETKMNPKNLSRVFALSLFQDKVNVSPANAIMEIFLNKFFTSNKMNRVLAYEISEDEAKDYLDEIKNGLQKCLENHDFVRGIFFWSKQFENYLDLKYPLTLEDRVWYADFFYSLAILPQMDYAMVEHWITVCWRCIEKTYLLPDDGVLQWDWKPLYRMLKAVFYPKQREKAYNANNKHMEAVIKFLHQGKKFFREEATDEILKEFLPALNPNISTSHLPALVWLTDFLPTNKSMTYWKDLLMDIWGLVIPSKTIDSCLLEIFGNLAKDQFGRQVLYSADELKFFLTTAHRWLEMPIGSGISNTESGGISIGSKKSLSSGQVVSGVKVMAVDEAVFNGALMKRRKERLRSLATIIVYSIYDADSIALSLVETWLKSIEAFFHPSNNGKWSSQLALFAQHLIQELFLRINEEESGQVRYEERLFITRKVRQRIVNLLRPLMLMSMFGKDQRTLNYSQTALKHMITLESDLVLPELLQSIYPSLETLVETHRTTAALGTLCQIVLPLVNRRISDRGLVEMMGVLPLVMPGLDINDPNKAYSAYLFCAKFFVNVPIHDYSESFYDVKDQQELIGRSALFEELVHVFLDKTFDLLSRVHYNKSSSNSSDNNIILFALFTTDIVAHQLSIGPNSSLAQSVLLRIEQFVLGPVVHNCISILPDFLSSFAIGIHCQIISNLILAFTKQLFEWLPMVKRRIVEEVEAGAGADPIKGFPTREQSNAREDERGFSLGNDAMLMWNLKVCIGMAGSLGGLARDDPELFQLSFQHLLQIINCVWSGCQSRPVYKLAAKLMRSVIRSCGEVWLREYKSHPSDVSDLSLLGVPLADHVDDVYLSIKPLWHTPTEMEKESIMKLLEIIHVEIERVREKIRKKDFPKGIEGSIQLCKSLTLFARALQSISALIPLHGESSSAEDEHPGDDEVMEEDVVEAVDEDDGEGEGENDDEITHKRPLACGYCFKTKNPEFVKIYQLRNSIGSLCVDLCEFVSDQSREDDVETIRMLIKCLRIFINDRGLERQKYQDHLNGYRFVKSLFKVGMHPYRRRFPRYLLLKRLYLQELRRLKHNGLLPRRPEEEDLARKMLTLLADNFCCCPYLEVRIDAQSVLARSLRGFKSLRYQLLSGILKRCKLAADKLSKDINDHQKLAEIKGCMHLMDRRSFMNILLRNHRYLNDFMLTVCQIVQLDRPSIQDLLKSLVVRYASRYSESPLSTTVHVALLQKFFNVQLSTEQVQKLNLQLGKRKSETIEALLQTRKSVLAHVQSKPPYWPLQLIACSLTETLSRKDLPVTADSVEFICGLCISEILILRRSALTALIRIMFLLKGKSTINGKGGYQLIVSNPVDPNLVIDKCDIGWLFWPDSFKAYRRDGIDAESVFLSAADSKGAVDALKAKFKIVGFWQSFFGFVAQESNLAMRGQGSMDDHLSIQLIRFYKSMFQLFEDLFLFDYILPVVQPWFQKAGDKTMQRSSLEFICGLIRGMKHWPKVKCNKVWEWFLPVLKSMLLASTPEMSGLWNQFWYYVASNRNPDRITPLTSMIMEDKDFQINPESDAAFNESKKLNFLRLIIRNHGWKLSEQLCRKIWNSVDNIQIWTCRYKLVREMFGNLVWELVSTYNPSHSKPLVSFSHVLNQLKQGKQFQVDAYSMDTHCLANDIITRISELFTELPPPSKSEVYGSPYSHFAKVFLRFVSEGLGSGRPYLLLSPLLSSDHKMLSRVMTMQNHSGDKDLSELAIQLIYYIPDLHIPFPLYREVILSMLAFIRQCMISTDSGDEEKSRRNKIRGLGLLQIFFFRHLNFMTVEQCLSEILKLLLTTIRDSHVEIRQLTSITLSGIAHSLPKSKVHELHTEFTQWLQTPIRKSSDKPAFLPEGIIKRHAAALGISSLILANPYTIPEWVPDALVQLSKHSTDPAPISTTVRHLFAEFRRTHQDTWASVVGGSDYVELYQYSVAKKQKSDGKKAVFTREHLDALEGLLTGGSAHYFF